MIILNRNNELKSFNKPFSMKSETDDGFSSCSNSPEQFTPCELECDKPVLPEIEHLKGKIGKGELESIRAVLNLTADVFQNIRRISVVAILSNMK